MGGTREGEWGMWEGIPYAKVKAEGVKGSCAEKKSEAVIGGRGYLVTGVKRHMRGNGEKEKEEKMELGR